MNFGIPVTGRLSSSRPNIQDLPRTRHKSESELLMLMQLYKQGLVPKEYVYNKIMEHYYGYTCAVGTGFMSGMFEPKGAKLYAA